MRHLKGVVYGGSFTGVVYLAVYFFRKKTLRSWHDGTVTSDTAQNVRQFSELMYSWWPWVLSVSVICAVLFFHFFKKEKEEEQ